MKKSIYAFSLVVLIGCTTKNKSTNEDDKPKADQKSIVMIKDNARGIINNTESPNVKLKSIDIGDCQVDRRVLGR